MNNHPPDAVKEIFYSGAEPSCKERAPIALISVQLLLRKGREVLLSLRKNTGYCDGLWSLVAGHVEEGELAREALVREAFEEAGILIDPASLKAVYATHRLSNRNYLSLVFECTSWKGEIRNNEPERCGRLRFFPIDDLPKNLVGHVADAISAIERGELYAEAKECASS